MKRNAIEKLIEWKQGGGVEPIFLSGMRGCGKTYLALDFAKSFYEGALYLNFEYKNEPGAAFLAEAGRMHTFDDFAACICRLFDVPEEYLDHFLIIMDEAYEEKAVWDFIFSAAGQMAVNRKKGNASVLVISSRMPALPEHFVHINLYPLQFDEFLAAVGQEWYGEVIRGHFQTNRRVPGIVHEELLDRFEDYLYTGGMPAAVNEYLCFETTDNIFQIHQSYLGCILYDIEQHYGDGETLKMRQILEVLPAQLGKENQKFQYRLIRRGATHALYQTAIRELAQAQLIRLCTREGKEDSFKVFPADIGMLHALSRRRIPENSSGSADCFGAEKCTDAKRGDFSKALKNTAGHFRSRILECYVMQTLCACGRQPEFWESASQARIDFLIDIEDGRIPVEVKTMGSTRSKSIGVYRVSHEIPYSLRISGRNFELSNQVRIIPYYAVFCL